MPLLPTYSPQQFDLRGLYFNAPAPATLKSRQPGLGERLTDGLRKAGIGQRTANRLGQKLSGIGSAAFDMTGIPSGYQAGKDLRRGNYLSGGLGAALSVLPIPGPAKRAGKGMFGRGIRAYHGSPHDFDRFALDKLGTGEGAQAYGHGLYFAENPEVAREYQRQLGGVTVNGTDPVGAEAYAHGAVQQYGDPRAALKAHLDYIKQTGWSAPEETAMLQKWARDGAPTLGTGGHLYEVNINAKPEDFLDWDKPFSEQPLSIFEKVRSTSPHDLSYKYLAGSPEAADKLRRAGIPGIRYLDQGSRQAGQGSRNYVVFDDSLIDILNKY